MVFDHDPLEHVPSFDTTFTEGFAPSTTRGQTTADFTGSVHTENYFTPLYTESQATDHNNVNTNQQPPIPPAPRDAAMAVVAATTAVEAEASATSLAAKMQASDELEAEAAAVEAAEFLARMEIGRAHV